MTHQKILGEDKREEVQTCRTDARARARDDFVFKELRTSQISAVHYSSSIQILNSPRDRARSESARPRRARRWSVVRSNRGCSGSDFSVGLAYDVRAVQVSERVSEVVTSGGKEDQEESVGKKTPNYDNNEGGRRGECRLQSSRTLCKGRET